MEIGDVLTVKSEVFTIGGQVLLREGQKVEVREIRKIGGYFGRICEYWIDEKILGVKLVGIYGIWGLSTFNQ